MSDAFLLLCTVEPRYNAVVGFLSGDHVIDEARYCEVTAESRSQYSSHSVLVQYCGKSTGSEIEYATSTFCWILITIQITSVTKFEGGFRKKTESKTDTKLAPPIR